MGETRGGDNDGSCVLYARIIITRPRIPSGDIDIQPLRGCDLLEKGDSMRARILGFHPRILIFSPFGAVSAREEESFACTFPWVSPAAIDVQPLRGCDVQKETRIFIALIRGFHPRLLVFSPFGAGTFKRKQGSSSRAYPRVHTRGYWCSAPSGLCLHMVSFQTPHPACFSTALEDLAGMASTFAFPRVSSRP